MLIRLPVVSYKFIKLKNVTNDVRALSLGKNTPFLLRKLDGTIAT